MMSNLMPLFISLGIVACLTATATAVRSVSRIWLRHWVEQRLNGAPLMALYLERPQRLVLAATTAVALTVFLTGVYMGTILPPDALMVAVAVVIYALMLLIFGQLIPRAIARRWARFIIPPLVPVLRLIQLPLMPILWLVRVATGEAAREKSEPQATDSDALEVLLREGALEGVGDASEIAIIEGVVHFEEKVVRSVMTPRDQVFALNAVTPLTELRMQLATSGYSRVPVFRDSLDGIEGVLHALDVFADVEAAGLTVRPVHIVHGDVRCNDLLVDMLRVRRHFAIVRDPQGRLEGIVTLEDLLEELVGDIRDEHDEPEPAPAPGPAAGPRVQDGP